MARTTRLAVALAGVALASASAVAPGVQAAQTATQASSGPIWAAASRATIHPGVVVTMAGVKCLAGYVLTNGRQVFLAVPASCSGVSDGQETDGCAEAQVPPGLPASIQGAKHKGTLVYSSFTRMQSTGVSSANKCAYNSLSLVRLDRRDIKRTNPSVPMIGGPTGVSTAAPAFPDQLTLFLSGAPVKAQATSTSGGGWAHGTIVDGEVNNLSVGAPALLANGRALGMVSIVPQMGGPGETTIGDLGRELTYLHRISRFAHVHLVKGTVGYKAP
jgi:hypothetical protein